MKIIAIGDVHGRNVWKSVADTQTFDQLVILGDYFDSPDISAEAQLDNFMDIIAFKRASPAKVVLLFGNHDLHYLPVAMQMNEVYTGFQYRFASQISYLIGEHLEDLNMCYLWENYLFSHAGVTSTWLKNAGHKKEAVDGFINELFRRHPQEFFFNGKDPHGDDVTQPPVWVRPASLKKNAYQVETIKQVVGHTKVKKLEMVKDRFFFIDTMNASKEYLVIEDGKVRSEKLK